MDFNANTTAATPNCLTAKKKEPGQARQAYGLFGAE